MQKDEIIKLINTYWKFDNDQDTTSTWHDKQDLINEIEQLTIPVVSGMFSTEQMEQAYNDGVEAEQQRCGEFNIENY